MLRFGLTLLCGTIFNYATSGFAAFVDFYKFDKPKITCPIFFCNLIDGLNRMAYFLIIDYAKLREWERKFPLPAIYIPNGKL